MNRIRRNGRRAAIVTAAVFAGALTGVSPASPQPPAEPAAQVRWGGCPEDVPNDPPVLQCATVRVPLDYRDPGGAQIDIMISRMAAKNPDERRGVLLLNPGGPGGSGLGLAQLLVSQGMPESVLERYDLIGMDTRGVAHSAPVSCGFTTDQPYFGNIPPHAADDAAVAERAEIVRGVADQCAAHDREGRLRHLSTANTARDLDRIRAALGEEKASFLGFSYGTALGAAYASMFPERSDRIVLDSNIGDTHLDQDGIRRYSRGMEETFPDFANWAAARHDTYGLGHTPEEVRDTYFTLAGRLDRGPVDGIDGNLFRLASFVTLYNPRSYEQAAQQWQSLLAGGTPEPDSPVGPPAPSPGDNAWSVFLAVTCNDVEWPEDIGSYQRAVAEDREKYPLYGASAANILPCAYWQPPLEPPVAVSGDGPGVLIVQNRRDPVTPLRGGELLNDKFGERSRLVTVDGSGHGVYVLGDNPCAHDVTTRYLVDGTLPEQDVDCAAAPPAG
ncbi:alpha/beta hydrolase [Nocardia sp. NPDC003345]